MRNGRRVARRVLVGMALMAMLVGCRAGQEPQPPQEATPQQPAAGGYDDARAQATYRQACASCHGANLEGSVGPNLQKVGAKYSKEQILSIIQNGRGQMPGGLVKGDEAENLAAWLADRK
ncbi:c-type cytochrome [Calditerricola satsumensis]|uniref:Cytochrome c domain-containing protein n=2 Tax=Calditerricola satsumensis TaxID=373054 RepID=A0A8J3B4X4_9BACI|nr:cytochrome c [Calditerricola satsumensis]GGJ94667.1 hypothetical protein GCM10007043_05550 [Calditerricola satsumensis]